MKRDRSSPSLSRREFLESSLGGMALLTAASAGMPARAQSPAGSKGTLRYWDMVDPKASLFLIGTEMDYEEEKLKSGFVFRNPNEKGRCGCGESFHV